MSFGAAAWSSEDISRSVAACGFAACPEALAPYELQALRAEACERLNGVAASRQSGSVSYQASIAGLGPLSLAFLETALRSDLLSRVFGGRYALSADRSCFTCYRDGGHLGAHLDEPAEACAVTIIAYLEAGSPDPEAPNTGLVLKIYGKTRNSVGQERLRIPTRAGTVVLGEGSRYWHERPVLQAGESVTAITACYKPLA